MKIGDKYRIQTEESAAWNDEFLSQSSTLNNDTQRIETERDELIRKKFGQLVKKRSIIQDKSKVNRDLYAIFGNELPRSYKTRYQWGNTGGCDRDIRPSFALNV